MYQTAAHFLISRSLPRHFILTANIAIRERLFSDGAESEKRYKRTRSPRGVTARYKQPPRLIYARLDKAARVSMRAGRIATNRKIVNLTRSIRPPLFCPVLGL